MGVRLPRDRGFDMGKQLLYVCCPRTGEAVSTGVDFALAFNVLSCCPACAGIHVWERTDALPLAS
jgi:hypothetical protein